MSTTRPAPISSTTATIPHPKELCNKVHQADRSAVGVSRLVAMDGSALSTMDRQHISGAADYEVPALASRPAQLHELSGFSRQKVSIMTMAAVINEQMDFASSARSMLDRTGNLMQTNMEDVFYFSLPDETFLEDTFLHHFTYNASGSALPTIPAPTPMATSDMMNTHSEITQPVLLSQHKSLNIGRCIATRCRSNRMSWRHFTPNWPSAALMVI